MNLRLKRRRLRCSFCGKSDSDIEKLIGGPAVSICDGCIAICNTILEATPSPFSGWQSLSDNQLLQSLKPSEAAGEGMRHMLQTQIDLLRKRGVSWSLIGSALGISRQAAWERFS